MIGKSGSSPDSECQENKGIGYFKGDLDKVPEPLLILPVSYTHLTLPTTPYV